MKPIQLKFSGINCFEEEQVIDFNKLSSGGIFGIFGQTGSGKSTILDAITLALFGNTTRSRVKGDFINTKSKKAEVCFTFLSKKEYTVERKYIIRKSGNVDAEARLVSKEEVLAEGVRATDALITKLTGLTMADFSKCVALPQGEFAAFLKAKAGERTELVGNLFGLDQYGDELIKKANLKKELLSQEAGQLSSQITALGENLETEINQLKEEQLVAKEQIAGLQEQLSINRAQILKQQEAKKKEEKYKELVNKKELLDKRAKDIEIKRNKLNYNNLVSGHVAAIRRYILLLQSGDTLEKALDKQRTSYFMTQNQMEDLVRRQKENLKKQETLPNSQLVLETLLKLSEELKLNQKTKKELETEISKLDKLKQEKEQCQVDKDQSLTALEELKKEIEKTQKEIKSATSQLELVKKQAENSSLYGQKQVYSGVLLKLQYHYDEIEKLNTERLKEIDKRNKLCKKNQEKSHEILKKIDFEDDFSKEAEMLKNDIDKMQHAKEHLSLLQGQKDTIKRQINDLEAKNTFASAEIEKYEQQKTELENAKWQLKDKLRVLEVERDHALLDNAEKTVSSETVIGAACPICGNTVTHLYPAKNTAVLNLNSAVMLHKKQIEHIETEIVGLQIKKCRVESNIEANDAIKQDKLKDIKELDVAINKVLISYVDIGEGALESFDKKLEQKKFKLDSLSKVLEKLEHLKSHTQELIRQNDSMGNNLIYHQETQEVLFGYIQEVQKLLAEQRLAELSLPVKDISQIEKEAKRLEERLVVLNGVLADQEGKKTSLVAQISSLSTKISSQDGQIKDLTLNVEIKQTEIAAIEKREAEYKLNFKSIDDRIEKIKSAKEDIQAESVALSRELAEITLKHDKIKTEKVRLEQQVETENEELKHLEPEVKKLLAACRVEEAEKLLVLVIEDAPELKREIEQFDKDYALCVSLLSSEKPEECDVVDKNLENVVKEDRKSVV